MDDGIYCIINPESAQKKWQRKERLRTYIKNQVQGLIDDTSDSKESTIELAKKICQERKIVVAAGGDGTIADVLQGIMEAKKEKDVLLGIIPLGSGNGFRKSFNIPLNIRKAVNILSKRDVKEVDLIDIEGRIAGFASIGVTAELTLKKLQGNIPGFLGHFLQMGRALSFPKSKQEIELFDGLDDDGNHFDRKSLSLDILDCVIGKTNYFGYGWKIAPKARLDDGYLDITFFEITPATYLANLPLIFFGVYQKKLRHMKAKKIVIRGKGLHIQYNGEYLGTKDRVEATVIPRAIRIICPLNKNNRY